MATELALVEGLQYATAHAMSAGTVYAGLIYGQTVGAGTITSSSVLSGLQEETGTGYARQSISVGTAVNGIMAVPAVAWNTGAATDWHTTVSACFIASASSSGVAIFVWDLGSGPYNMAAANTELDIPGVNYFFENPGGI